MQDTIIGIVIVAVSLGALFAWFWWQDRMKAQQREAIDLANTTYQGWLAKLKIQPTNADIKQKALKWGRIYSNLTRESKGVTVYDEMALMNDISAATAGAAVATVATVSGGASVEDRLKTIDDLRTKGVISDQEHAARRQKILETL
jgi:hypothetical protein